MLRARNFKTLQFIQFIPKSNLFYFLIWADKSLYLSFYLIFKQIKIRNNKPLHPINGNAKTYFIICIYICINYIYKFIFKPETEECFTFYKVECCKNCLCSWIKFFKSCTIILIIFVKVKAWPFLTHQCPSFVFRWFLRYNLRVAPVIYRLIGSTLKGNFFGDPFFF